MSNHEDAQAKNKRIAKNTLVLYVRMFATMLISIYTSRVILGALDVSDYGVYSVVGGAVGMFSLLTGSLIGAIGRFLTVEIGKGEMENTRRLYSTSLIILMGLAIVSTLLIETVGLWWLENKLVIPPDRMWAARIVFHISMFNFVSALFTVPQTALIVSHERMSAFAYVSILDVVYKLVIAYGLVYSPIDRLIMYAILLGLAPWIQRVITGIYCSRHFPESRFMWVFDKRLIRAMFGFASWNFIASLAGMLCNTGQNFVLNMFFGPVVNAARNVAGQVNVSIANFAANFTMSMNPQIMKSYASKEYDYMLTLAYRTARFPFYLMYVLALPVMVQADFILNLWLIKVPDHATIFVQIVLINTTLELLGHPLDTLANAQGDIRKFTHDVTVIKLLNQPLAGLCLRMGFEPVSVFYVTIALNLIMNAAKLRILRTMMDFSARAYLANVYGNALRVVVLSAPLPIALHLLTEASVWRLIWLSGLSVAFTSVVVFFCGMTGNERRRTMSVARNFINRWRP